MQALREFVVAHDVLFGLVGTVLAILAVFAGYGRQHRDAMAARRAAARDLAAAPPVVSRRPCP